jgi:endonuclease YncB( thermonuclease family)
MKTLLKPFAIALLLTLSACAAKGTMAPTETVQTATVRSVKSGDTLILQTRDMQSFQVQLFGIDAPEMGQDYVGKAQRRLRDLTVATEVQYDMIGGPEAPEREVMLWVDGEFVNGLMVREGLAWVIPGIDIPELKEAFGEARTNKRGLWRDNRQVPPWEFRGARRAEQSQNLERARALHKKEAPEKVDYRSIGLRDSYYYYYNGKRYPRYRRYYPYHYGGADPTPSSRQSDGGVRKEKGAVRRIMKDLRDKR